MCDTGPSLKLVGELVEVQSSYLPPLGMGALEASQACTSRQSTGFNMLATSFKSGCSVLALSVLCVYFLYDQPNEALHTKACKSYEV